MGDPSKRKKTLKFLILTAVVGVVVATASTGVQILLNQDNPLKVCINERDTNYRVSSTLEVFIDQEKYTIPAQVGFKDGCQRSLYTLTDDGTIYAEWIEEYPFEVGHFLWMWEFPLRDMQEDKSRILVNGQESPQFIRTQLMDGAQYRAEFTSKAYDEFKERDFAPPK